MRKYIRLTVMLIALFSVIAMLVYRYKYYNLRSLLEIMNFFTAAKTKNSKCLLKHSNTNITSEITFGINHWTEIFDGVYVYSLHVLSKRVISLAYSNGISVTELKSIQCNLWFDGITKSLPSNFDIHLLSGKRSSFLYYVECRSSYDYDSPNAVTFSKNNISVTLPLFHKQQHTAPFTACVSPLPSIISDTDSVLEFLTFHSHLGIKHYILYYTAFSEAVQNLLVNLANECDIIIEFLPWIPPPKFEFSRTKLKPFFIDCIFHVASLQHSDFVLLLDLNSFIVPEETVDLQKFVQDYSHFDFLQLEKKMFCLENSNDLIAQELNITFNTLLKTKMSNLEAEPLNVIYNIKKLLSPLSFEKLLSNKNKQSYKKIKSTSASLFLYANCSKNSKSSSNISYTENKKMWLFKRAFFESCIYKEGKLILNDHIN